ncbi:MAG: type ISP restriction/modification enzyme [Polynucleobacter sp.]|uniref:DEAD/DEAH box helicase n=1 Tax=Polynucleobacter sp. TaxID=2029855 RepID=UPI002720A664|nr:type ISP restriction/modification enzyme [Polynucleobacter sp.]MDO8714242.1 type ISP restriction/modification enzyme [Polynucleobacter sp.]
MNALNDLLQKFRQTSQTEREKGNYFEKLVKVYLLNEPIYKDLFNGQVWLWEDWRKYWIQQGNSDPGPDAGIDLVAVEAVKENPRIFAIQAKFYAEDAKIRKSDGIDSFFSALGKKPFTHGMLFLTTYQASHHVLEAVQKRDKEVNIVGLNDLEASVIDWLSFVPAVEAVKVKEHKQLRDYQQSAVKDVLDGLASAERGKLIMACGTGKTFTALRLAEQIAGKGGKVLFLVPSLSLMSQTLTEWTQESKLSIHSYAVCSDSEVGKKREDGDDFQMLAHELQIPATTSAKSLATGFKARIADDSANGKMSVVFSTYHSIEVISEAQKKHGLSSFDLIICDEAHRTTGQTHDGDDESAFVKIHNADFIQGTKRLYMTATPRVYGVAASTKAKNESIELYSMDNPKLFGEDLHVLPFSEAVKKEILVDYKVIVLTINEDHISQSLQKLLADPDNNLRVDDAAKIVGCWRALAKQDTQQDLASDPQPMRRAVAFCQVIEVNKGAKTHKVSSKNIAGMFERVVNDYRAELIKSNPETKDAVSQLACQAMHVDGSMNAAEKQEKLEWLKAPIPDDTCRILSNVRCLSEGVDVPALDAVLFLTPRNSQVDVVQSVGRVMRQSKDRTKKLGYVVLPVVIPAGMEPEEALNDNKTYKVVWEVLQALRSHDDRFDAMINKLDLTGQDKSKMEVIAITNTIAPKPKQKDKRGGNGKGTDHLGKTHNPAPKPEQGELNIHIGEIERAILAKVVQKCGNRLYWDVWAADIAKIATTHISRITGILATPENSVEITTFEAFLKELKDDLNDSITKDEAIEMLAQHIITKPVFDALFEGYSFTQNNPVSKAMQVMMDVLDKHNIQKEAETLEKFYASVRTRAEKITDLKAKQKIIVELYDKFFSNAFPKLKDKLGIVYTPVEVVDFIIHSVNDVLKSEFRQSLGSKNVHIIDPFTGTGTFITRLLQSGLISPEELEYKYQNEIHANEIVLLAYYIAAINIEQVYHSIMGGDYVPFNGICLTDTFALYEPSSHKIGADTLADNSTRRRKQKKLDIRVIMGNPPYSAGQTSGNDNNANIEYPTLDESIRSTYAAHSKATLKNALYDSYIRAIRWASNRVGKSGVIGFVTNAGFMEANTADGLRKCLAEEFSSIYVFHLRGNARTAGEQRKQEKDNVFGVGSRAPIAISLLVKNPDAKEQGKIVFHDIGDYLSREDKLEKISTFKSIEGISAANGWLPITPDQHHDWVNQRDDSFGEFLSLGEKKSKNEISIFEKFSNGIKTNRDAWCYNGAKNLLTSNIVRMVDFYNSEVKRYKATTDGLAKNQRPDPETYVYKDATKISWTREVYADVGKGNFREFVPADIVVSLYRPFTKQWMYFNQHFNNCVYQMPRIFPNSRLENRVISVVGMGTPKAFSAVMSNVLPDVQLQANGQCFPLKLYESKVSKQGNAVQVDLLDLEIDASKERANTYTVKDGITDAAFNQFKVAYMGVVGASEIRKEDLFYYIYGLLHSPDYKARYADNLSKELPRIPAVTKFADFQAFSQAGRKLADLHVNYETVAPYPVSFKGGAIEMQAFTDADYRVTQMKFASKADKTRVVYNHKITMEGIPLEAYDYVVNGKPALEWVMERQAVTTHKDSQIVNDANLWATETVGDAAYPLKLFQRVVTVSLETMKLVRALPRLEI